MNPLTIGLLGALLATNQPQAVSNLVQQQTGVAVPLAASPEEKELEAVMTDDDAALDEVHGWIRDNDAASGTNKIAAPILNQRIHARLALVRKAYEQFLRNHPDSAHGYLAFGSFLNEIGEEDEAQVQYENSKQLDPKNPAVWNNLANYYGEHGPTTNAFVDYAEAIHLNPNEPVYYQNFATTVYLYRKDAREFFGLNEQQVFDQALALYRQAMKLAPQDFTLATDYAESFYGIKPLRTNDALVAWTNALSIAHTDAERQGVEIHLARVKIAAGFFDEASNHLAAVTNEIYAALKNRLERNLAEKENPPTNSVAEISTNLIAQTNLPVAPTNNFSAANLVSTNAISSATNFPAMTNPPPFSPRNVATLTNVPPPPKPLQLEIAPPDLKNQVTPKSQ